VVVAMDWLRVGFVEGDKPRNPQRVSDATLFLSDRYSGQLISGSNPPKPPNGRSGTLLFFRRLYVRRSSSDFYHGPLANI